MSNLNLPWCSFRSFQGKSTMDIQIKIEENGKKG